MSDIFLKLVNMSISAGWIVLAILLIRILFKKIPKWINAALWSLVGIRLVLPFSIKSILSLIPSTSTIPQDIAESKAPAINSGFETVNNTVNPVISEVLAPSVENSISPINVIVYIITAVWITGIISMLIYTAVSYRKIYLRIREGMPDADNTVLCDRIETPFIMGIIKPKIYIPSNMDREYKEYVTAHETAHIERRDYLWKPLAFAFLTVYWFNPLVWAAYIAFCRDIEFACDERVIKRHGEEYKAPYSEALLNCSIKKKTLNINPLAFGEISVKDRIKNILNYKKPSLWIISASIILCGCLLVAFLTDPVDSKKSENKPDSTEAVVPSDDEKEKLSSEDTSAESEITVSTITSSKAETPVSGSSPAKSDESDEYINERDNFGNLDIKIVKDIKDILDLRFGEYSVEDIYIEKYYGTYSDGSVVISVGFVDKRGEAYQRPDVAILYPAVYEVSGYVVNSNFRPYVYYKGRVELLDTAFQEGLISAKSIDELFNNNPDVITYNGEIYN